ncbi:hypothetical protein EI94DRAFT_1714164 [Lactarius quietus]|nr:hypothetical protein EI94DRAFT_1714164 [Lactarius quietus]
MTFEPLSLRTPHPRYDLGGNAELPPSTSDHDVVPQLNTHQPDANFSAAYNGPTYADYGHGIQYRDNPHRGNLWHEGPLPPATTHLEGQYTYQANSRVGFPPPGNAEHTFVAPGPSRGEYHIVPPARDLPNNGVRDRPPPMPDVANPFSRNVPDSDPSRISATEDLKRLMSRYLDNPDSQVDTFRVGLSPSGGRLRMMIVLDIDI